MVLIQAQQDDLQAHPENTAPSQSPRPLARYEEIVPSGTEVDLDLVQPPIQMNTLNPLPVDSESMSREEFWRQFATTQPLRNRQYVEGYDSLQATLNNGFWFGGMDVVYLEPTFESNNAFSISNDAFSTNQHVDFGFDVSYRLHVGFQTSAGPAAKLSYWGLNSFSAVQQFTTGSGDSAIATIDLGDTNNSFKLGEAANDGSRITVQQQLKFDSVDFTLFKDQWHPISRVRGAVALRAIDLRQNLFAELVDPISGVEIVRNTNQYQGIGPKIGIEYFRPIGHTQLELVSGVHGSVLFGRREQVFAAQGASSFGFQQLGKVETLPILEMHIGLQWVKQLSRCRSVFLKTSLESQYWAGSDTAMQVGDSLGFYGLSFGFGFGR
ncbi:MAG: Lpg1974 family pore-forming outer membrane protein [Pirellulaceae bacterium]|nr:Lpg1974 family pore-forming outer membrane protein [Pirellulaceae bacterium]